MVGQLLNNNKRSIKKKLIAIMLPLSILPLLIFSGIIKNIYDEGMIKRTQRNIEDSNRIIADRISRVLTDSENCSNYLTVNINRIIETNYQGSNELSGLTRDALIKNELNSAKVIFKEIESIAYIDIKDRFYYSNFMLLKNHELIADSLYMKQLKTSAGKSIWFSSEKRNFLITDENKKVLTLGKKVWQITTGETLGYLFININMNEITKHLNGQLIDYYLIDGNGNIITTKKELAYTDKIDILDWVSKKRNSQIIKQRDTKYLATQYEIRDYGWDIIGITDLNTFNMDEKSRVILILIIAASFVILNTILSLTLTNMITKPIVRLKEGAEKIAEGNLDFRFKLKVKDEIGQLGNSFNYMSQRITELLDKVEKEEKKKREYELSLIQQQVKPHFLYNTLDIIIKLSEMGKSKEAQRAAKKLADYYRRSLSDRKEIIDIKEEIKIVTDYLELQKIRYSNLFEYEISVPEEILCQPILKLTLQPLVENAIYHGLKYKDQLGKILITGKVNDEHIEIIVEDNGIGIKEEELDRILDLKVNPQNHFGIYSVDHRMKLFFGDQYGLEFKSIYGEGTEIKILLPKG
ncbi:MAG: signal transduction protein [Clostridia bacterium]|jgi:two-component system sensor histidine kinase YesM|nr:signal transduction protein [Clostridia bacterium]